MLVKATVFLFLISFALPAAAQEKVAKIPKNTIDCTQFRKTGPQEWVENGTAVFNLGSIDDINLTNQPVTPGYFKFDGIDLFPVLEQKCSAAAGGETAPAGTTALAVGAQSASLKPETEPQAAAPASAPKLERAQEKAVAREGRKAAAADEAPSVRAAKISETEAEQKCPDRKSVYAANSFEDKSVIEIALDTKANGGGGDFILRENMGGDVQWAFSGRMRQGRFIFAAIPYREVYNQGRFAFASVPPQRNESISLPSSFVRPNRDGSGEAILTINGLRTIFASKEDSRRFKFEGKRPVKLLPEAFYFDRCE
jgi:hypothetical protein